MAITDKYPTWADIKAKVERDMDTEDEDQVNEDELIGYANEAIEEAEGEIHPLYQDYFLKRDLITLVEDTAEYALASDIYGHSIRRVIYRNGTKLYVIDRILDWHKFERYAEDLVDAGSTNYRYFLLNETAGAPKLLFTPNVYESGQYVTAWYLRRATRMTGDASIFDVPEALNFTMQYMKTRFYEKEGNPRIVKAIKDLELERVKLVNKLAVMVPDGNNEIEPDLSFYQEMN